jgi:hypothetical protein
MHESQLCLCPQGLWIVIAQNVSGTLGSTFRSTEAHLSSRQHLVPPAICLSIGDGVRHGVVASEGELATVCNQRLRMPTSRTVRLAECR